MFTLHKFPNAANSGPEREPADLRRVGQVVSVEAGELLYEEGHEADAIHFLIAGGVKLTRRDERRNEFILDLVRPGTPFGEEGVVTGRRRLTSARALTASRVVVVSRAALDRALHTSPSIAADLLERMARRQSALFERMFELTWNKPADRIASAHERLADLVEASGAGAHVDEADVAAHARASAQAVRAHLAFASSHSATAHGM